MTHGYANHVSIEYKYEDTNDKSPIHEFLENFWVCMKSIEIFLPIMSRRGHADIIAHENQQGTSSDSFALTLSHIHINMVEFSMK